MSNHISTVGFKGVHQARCLRPLTVMDPEKFRALFHRAGFDAPVLLGPKGNVLPVMHARKSLSVLKARGSEAILREIEQLLEGGDEKWRATVFNIFVNVGLDYLLDAGISAGTQITSWFVLLTNSAPSFAPGDTMASHAGWTENQNYGAATRPAFTDGGVSSQSLDNSGSPASFVIDTDSQVLGGVAITSDNTKGGTTGTLLDGGAFAGGDKNADTNDTVDTTSTLSATDV